jgi:hypothetical protein
MNRNLCLARVLLLLLVLAPTALGGVPKTLIVEHFGDCC